MQNPTEQKHIKQCVEFILEECRMVLPGIQALFGFQLIAVFNQGFNGLNAIDKYVHLIAILLTVLSIGFLMGPAAYHRQTHPEGIPAELCKIGTQMVRAGMAILIVSISLEIYLVTQIITQSTSTSLITCLGTFAILFGIWYIFPWCHKSFNPEHSSKVQTEVSQKSI